jgi:hypothetical protein
MERKYLLSLSTITCTLLLAACTRSALPANGNYFLAPTLAGNSTAVLLETHTPPPATATAECENHLVFLLDVTVPDGTHFAQGETIEKSWEIRNEGTCPWVRGYFVQLEDGPGLGAIERQPLPEAQPGEAVVLTIQFKAPNVPGNYRSSWRAHDFGEQPFGVLFYVDIVVD